MTVNKIKLYIAENLPSGGARKLFALNLTYLKKKYDLEVLISSVNNYKPRNFINYLWFATVKSNIDQYLLSKSIKDESILLAYHSWLSKSFSVLRFFPGKKIYICHEPMREYYDPEHIEIQTLKERMINILRYPLKIIDRANVHNADVVISNSRFSQKQIHNAYGVNSEVIYPGIEFAEKIKHKVNKQNQVISVGAINKLKGFDRIIKILSTIPLARRPNLLVIGNIADQDYVKFLMKLAREENVNLKIKEDMDNDQMERAYKQSLAFMYTPVAEPFGVVILEAMSYALPIIAYSKGGGYSEIIDDKNGILFTNLESVKLGKQIEKFLSDPDKLRIIGKYNQKYVRKFSSIKMNRQISKVIDHLVASI